MARHLRRLLPLVVLLGSLADATPVGAHAEVRESDPPAGGTAATGREEISLTFISLDASEPVRVSVLDPHGDEIVDGDPELEETTTLGTTVSVPVRPLEEGTHVVQWRAMSSDGDGPTSGTFEFTAEERSAGGPGLWLVWITALAIPVLIFLRPGGRRRKGGEDRI